ncbi:hypothetical protein [Corticibacter populi]|uniref:hypothetical protein n=1 Tax=Corticibacter populi TaxID=1550736 RepID=UPI00102BB674|nr:hypothetical protein [Corticibacter populi]
MHELPPMTPVQLALHALGLCERDFAFIGGCTLTDRPDLQLSPETSWQMDVRGVLAAIDSAKAALRTWQPGTGKEGGEMLTQITLPAGTPLSSENIGSLLRGDAVIVCGERDAWLIRAALGLPDVDQRLSTSRNHVAPLASIPSQAASEPVMSTTNSSSLESRSVASQSRICTADSCVSTIHVVVNLHQ